MRRPPPLSAVLSLPATSSIAILAIALTFARYGDFDVARLIDTPEVRRGEPWRFLTTTLPHGNILHLFFNLSWWWTYGSLVETIWGGARLLAMAALFAIASMAGELAFFGTGIGLSGVIYGLWAFFAVLEGHDRRTEGAADARTSKVFIYWFFLCIGLTVFDIMPIANAAHGFGAVAGLCLGASVRYNGRRRLLASCGTGLLVVTLFLLGTIGRPWVNIQRDARGELWLGTTALMEERNTEAVPWLEDAVHLAPKNGKAWWNLGIAYHRVGRSDESNAAFSKAVQLDPSLMPEK